MVIQKLMERWMDERGDTLVEVVLALAILSFVLLGATSLALGAFRGSQTARERTEVASESQEQMEALRSFRDNHTWKEFRSGGSGFVGIDTVGAPACHFDPSRHCFHMQLASTGAGTEWVPVAGGTTGTVPTSVIEISTNTPGSVRSCNYDFRLDYGFTATGGSLATNHISTRLANLRYDPLAFGAGPCS